MITKATTLIELLVSLAIIAVISSVTLLSFSMLNSKKLDGAATNLLADLWWVRSQTISKHFDYIIRFNTNNYSIYKDANNNNTPDSSELVESKTFSVTLNSVSNTDGSPVTLTLPTDVFFYNPLGKSQNREIELGDGGKIKTVKIFAQTGYARFD